ncbi:MAG: hypothetical protein ACXADO_10675 [Candidatus Thorarchaeota archaeon]|jgi:acetyltransferase-like isoleucine patch superfamily enzyme
MPGIRIGEGSVIAAGCVVDQDIPPYSDVSVKQKLTIKKKEE